MKKLLPGIILILLGLGIALNAYIRHDKSGTFELARFTADGHSYKAFRVENSESWSVVHDPGCAKCATQKRDSI